MTEIPQEFLSALSGDTAAATRFSGLSDAEKEEIISRARNAISPQELDQLTSRL